MKITSPRIAAVSSTTLHHLTSCLRRHSLSSVSQRCGVVEGSLHAFVPRKEVGPLLESVIEPFRVRDRLSVSHLSPFWSLTPSQTRVELTLNQFSSLTAPTSAAAAATQASVNASARAVDRSSSRVSTTLATAGESAR